MNCSIGLCRFLDNWHISVGYQIDNTTVSDEAQTSAVSSRVILIGLMSRCTTPTSGKAWVAHVLPVEPVRPDMASQPQIHQTTCGPQYDNDAILWNSNHLCELRGIGISMPSANSSSVAHLIVPVVHPRVGGMRFLAAAKNWSC